MTWIRLEDSFPNHPKIAQLSDKTFRLHITGLCYAGKQLSDGFVPASIWRSLGIQNASKCVRKLVSIGLWDKVEGGYQIHDYLKYQTSKEQAEQEKEVNRVRAARARQRKIEAQSHAVTPPVLPKPVTPLVTITPTPTPTPTPKNKDKRLVRTSFELFWEIYPRKDSRKKAQASFEKALKTTDVETILEGVKRYVAFLKTTDQKIAMPATWLNGERWNDELAASVNTAPTVLPHAKTTDPKSGEDYCQRCGSAWPCIAESKKGGNPFWVATVGMPQTRHLCPIEARL